jgi:cytochrome b561
MSTRVDGALAPQEEQSYGFVARSLHWVIFGLLFAQYAVGLLMPHIRRDTPQEGLVDWHLSLGAAIVFFVAWRVIWRYLRPTPLSPAMPRWDRIASRAVHDLLYLFLVVTPLLGWAASGFYGYTVRLFGMITLPALAAKGTGWAHTAGDIHDTLVYVMLGLIGLHVLGALYHYFIVRDRILQRMLPGV